MKTQPSQLFIIKNLTLCCLSAKIRWILLNVAPAPFSSLYKALRLDIFRSFGLLTFLPLSCKIRSAYLECVYVSGIKKSQSHDQHWHIWASLSVFSSPFLLALLVHSASFHGTRDIACIPIASRVIQYSSSWHILSLLICYSPPDTMFILSFTVAAGEKSVRLTRHLFFFILCLAFISFSLPIPDSLSSFHLFPASFHVSRSSALCLLPSASSPPPSVSLMLY